MKRFTMFLLPFAAIVLGLAAAASADDLPNYYLTLVYNTSYDASGHDVGRLSSTVVDTGNNTTKRTIQLSGTAVVHSFEVYYTAQNMAPDQDTACFEYYPVVTGGAALGDSDRGIGDFFTPSTLATTPVDPPEMGLPGNTSNLGSSLPFALNYWNGIGIDQIVNFGSIGVMALALPATVPLAIWRPASGCRRHRQRSRRVAASAKGPLAPGEMAPTTLALCLSARTPLRRPPALAFPSPRAPVGSALSTTTAAPTVWAWLLAFSMSRVAT